MENTIKIPKALHEVHGEVSNLRDILFAHGLAIAATFTLIMIGAENMATWQKVIMGILAYDLVGGVVANFSYSTSSYYAGSSKKRKGFLLLHLLQPTLLALVFAEDWQAVLIASAYILLASIIVNALKPGSKQVMSGAFFAVSGIFLLHLPILEADGTLQFLLNIFLLKLPLAWAVNWYAIGRN